MPAPSDSLDQVSSPDYDPTPHHQATCTACDIAQRFRSLIETGPSVMVCLSPDHRILEFNRAAERLLGQRRAAVLGQDCLKLFISEDDREAVAADIHRVLNGEPTQGFEKSVRTSNGDERILRWDVSRVLDDAGQPAGIIAVGQDVTEHKQAAQAHIEQQQRLRTLVSELAMAGQRERRRIAIGLHDQVGQALAVAKLKLNTALGSELPVPARTSLEQSQALLDESIQAIRSLTFQLSSAVLRELGLEAALQHLVEWFDASNDDMHFVFVTDTQTRPLGEDESAMLYDIACELMFNATKHARARTVQLWIKCVVDQIRIVIKDDGRGFDTACLDDSFDAEGGFGFFSIRERLSHLGGELEIESSIGHGTRVAIVAPLEAP